VFGHLIVTAIGCQTVEILRACGSGRRTRFVRRLSSRTEELVLEAELKRERAEIKADYKGEHKELAAIYVDRGVDPPAGAKGRRATYGA
jgi:hypothetical protein